MTRETALKTDNLIIRLKAIIICLTALSYSTLLVTHKISLTTKPPLLSDALQAQLMPLGFFIMSLFLPRISRRISAQGIAINSALLIFVYGTTSVLCATGHLPYVFSVLSLIAVIMMARVYDPRLAEPGYALPVIQKRKRKPRPPYQPVKRLLASAICVAAYAVLIRIFTGSFNMTTYPETFRTGFTIHIILALAISAFMIATAHFKHLPLRAAFPNIILLMTIGMVMAAISDDQKDPYLFSAMPFIIVMMIAPFQEEAAKSLKPKPIAQPAI